MLALRDTASFDRLAPEHVLFGDCEALSLGSEPRRSPQLVEGGAFFAFWGTVSFATNGVVFFFAGASAVNFFIRCAPWLPNRNLLLCRDDITLPSSKFRALQSKALKRAATSKGLESYPEAEKVPVLSCIPSGTALCL